MSQTKESSKDLKDAKGGGGKPRVFALANELGVDTKTVLEFCKELGYAGIKNQLNALEPEQVDAIKARSKRGGPAKPAAAAPAPAKPAASPAAPKLESKIPTLTKPKTIVPPARPAAPAKAADPAPAAPVPAAAAPAAAPPAPLLTPPEPAPVPAVAAPPRPSAPPAPRPAAAAAPPAAPPAAVAPAPAVPPPAAKPAVVAEPAARVTPPPAPAAVPALPAPAPVVEAPPAPAAVAPPAAVTVPAAAVVPPVAVEPPAAPAPVPPEPAVVASAAPASPPPPAAPMVPPPGGAGRMPNLNNRPQNLNNRPTTLGGNRPPPRPAGNAPPPARPLSPPPAGGPPPRPAPGAPLPGGPRPPAPAGGPPGSAPRPGVGGPPNVPPRSGGPFPPPRTGPGGMPARTGPGGMPPRGPSAPGGPAGGPPPRTGPGGPVGPRPPAGAAPRGQIRLTPEQIQRLRELERSRGGQKMSMQDIQNKVVAPPTGDPAAPPRPPGPGGLPGRGPIPRPFTPATAEDEAGRGGPPGAKKPGEVAGRGDRHKARQVKGRQGGPTTDRGSLIRGPGGSIDVLERRFGSQTKKHRGARHVVKTTGPVTGKVEIALPITVRSLSEAIGMKSGELLLKLKQLTNSLFTVNSGVEFDVAGLIAGDRGIELVAKTVQTAETELTALLKKQQTARAADEHRVARPPVVTIMGHVDHGKTSLLDKIRQQYGLASDVVSTEHGGITQVIRAWRVEKDGKSVTFLDTPGHEAFTKMRARGANVTDIAVIVVSAADGIMPQTQEAVAHAKAAGVDIIVAINKVDLPGANPEKIKNQLYSLELVPEEMGGNVPVVLTSAVTGVGVGDLIDSIALLAELSDPPLLADPELPASGTCLEAYLDPEEGVQATLLVQEGTLNRGDVMLCGATFGKVRAMYDDLGRPIQSAGPSTPVRITGLDEVPDADDPFYAVPEVGTAREIAGKRKDRKNEAALHKFTAVSLDKLKERNAAPKISELKVILKAEARGSVEAIKKEMEKLIHDEVRVRILHAGIGAITESDVTLALTSPDDTLVVGFNVTADDAALRLAEERGLTDKLREYNIIYKLTDDIKAALEGRLKPTEEVVHLGRAVIRQTFKHGKVGVIAGCYVTSGTIERSARVRVIREGVVIFPPADKVVGLDSLKRFKDDAKDVREGFECGMKITGYDDVKAGDVIEAFKIEIRQRTL